MLFDINMKRSLWSVISVFTVQRVKHLRTNIYASNDLDESVPRVIFRLCRPTTNVCLTFRLPKFFFATLTTKGGVVTTRPTFSVWFQNIVSCNTAIELAFGYE